MSVCIYTVSHTDFEYQKLPAGYRVIKVGKALEDPEHHFVHDDEGDNISEKNRYYCELTALYWIWKNGCETDYTGLTHYRRHFIDWSMSSEKNDVGGGILRVEKIERLLKKYSVIMEFPSAKTDKFFVPSKKKSLRDQEINWFVLREALLEKYPETVSQFDRFIYGRVMMWKNMFITQKHILDDYCRFLFDVLETYDVKMDKYGFERIDRIDGYLGEYLLPTYFYTYYPHRKIFHMEIKNGLDCSTYANGKIMGLIRKNYILLYAAKYFVMYAKAIFYGLRGRRKRS